MNDTYPSRLHHRTPTWVETGATFHIRISTTGSLGKALSEPRVANQLLASAQLYHEQRRWRCRLMLLMPDHIHALLVFPHDRAMSPIVGAWKGFQSKHLGISWQDNFFDHRIRHQHELDESEAYIRLNPVRRNLCAEETAWPWVLSCIEQPVQRPGSTL